MIRTVICFILCLISTSLQKTFTKCELVHELRSQGLPEYLMKDFVCLVNAESSFRTNAVGVTNSDGSHDYGIFQINDRYWCNAGRAPGKGCNVRCSDLLADDITASVSCAKTVLAQQGISAWAGWVSTCEGKTQPDLNC